MLASAAIAAIVRGEHGDPFAILGPHAEAEGDVISIRAFVPQASRVVAIDAADGSVVADLPRIDEAGFFAGPAGKRTRPFHYRLRLTIGESVTEIEDPYRFGPILGDIDVYLLGEGTHLRLYERFGAHSLAVDGVAGTSFVVWAPNARRVSVVGTFNDWDGRRNPMRRQFCGTNLTGCFSRMVPAIRRRRRNMPCRR